MKKKRFIVWIRHSYPFPKILITMKIIVLLMLGLCNLTYANVFAQKMKVTVDFKQTPLNDFFLELRKQTQCDFLYNYNTIKDIVIDLEAKDKELSQLLDELLPTLGLEYTFDKNVVVVKTKSVTQEQHGTVQISGKIIDKNNYPLPGVTISIKGTNLGTSSNTDGEFSFSLPKQDNIVLVFSFIGMQSQEFKFTGQEFITITLEEDNLEMDEVVITGYQRIDPKHLTSAITTLKMDDIYVPGINRIDQLLEGRVPGLIFMQNSGMVGVSPRLRIRGTSTILGNQEPLWVVDGIIQNDPVNVDPQRLNDLDFVNLLGNAISGINPADIEQIDVMKDASATALYGARAANGVIVITTKKGKAGPPRFSYNMTGSFTRRPYYSDKAIYMMNSKERMDVSRELMERGAVYSSIFKEWIGYEKAYMDHYHSGSIDFEEFEKRTQYYETVNTDWFGILCQNSFSHNHSFSVNGGAQNTSYYFSLGYMDNADVIKGQSEKRYTANLSVSTQYNKVNMQFGFNGSINDKKYHPQELGLLNYAYTTSRALPARNEDGSLWYYQRDLQDFNIINEKKNSEYLIEQKTVSMNSTIQYDIFPGVKLSGTGSYSFGYTDEETWFGEESYKMRSLNNHNKNLAPYGGEIHTKDSKNKSYTLRAQLDLIKPLDKDYKHSINFTGGWELSSTRYNDKEIRTRGYYKERGKAFADYGFSEHNPIHSYYFDYVYWYLENSKPKFTERLTNLMSAYISFNYIYDNRFIFNFNTRADWSNAFGDRSNEKLLPIWSFSGRWNMKEDIGKNQNWLDNLALRVSYGIQGNMNNSQPTRVIIRKAGYDQEKEGYVSTVHAFPNRDLKWETTHSVNSALDFSFLNGKIHGSVTYYYKKTVDAFMNKVISIVNGRDSYIVNKGNIENQGIEMNLSFNLLNNIGGSGGKRGFTWRIDPQIGQALNKIINKAISKENNLLSKPDFLSLRDFLNGDVHMAGVPLNTFYSMKFAGLTNEGLPSFHGLSNYDETDRYPKMKDVERVLSIVEKSGTRVPVFQGGVYNYLAYRNFSLSVNLAYSLGNKTRLLNLTSGSYGAIFPTPERNIRKEFVNRWRIPGDEKNTDIPGLQITNEHNYGWWDGYLGMFAANPTNGFTVYELYDMSDIRVVKADYLKIQSLALSYVLDPAILKNFGLNNLSISLSGSNLYTFCNKKLRGQNPEQFGANSVIELSIRPTYSLSVTVGF